MPPTTPLPSAANAQTLAERSRTICLTPAGAEQVRTSALAPDDGTWSGSPALGDKLLARGQVTALALGERFVAAELLGMGATGQVLGVRDRNLERAIAVKVLTAGEDLQAVERFVAEAQTIAGLSHPNVLPVHDLDLDPHGRLFFTMSRVAGRSLGAAIERSSPGGSRDRLIASANDLVNVFLGVLRAMAYAHHRGLIHQDIKPENIMLGDFGEVILVDWGSAARLQDGRTTQLYGTPLYMSPEQARSEYADQRSDIYCLGASLFHALVLRPPTWDDQPEAFLEKKRRGAIDPPSPGERRGCPPPLLAIALMAMHALPSERYPSAEAMLKDLEHYQAGLAVAALHEPWWRRLRRWYQGNTRWFWTAVLAVAALALAGVLLVVRQLEERSTWMPVFSEDCNQGSLAALAQRWVVRTQSTTIWPPPPFAEVASTEPGLLVLGPDGLTSVTNDHVVDLSSRVGISGDIRIQWDYTPLDQPRNLNCFFGGPDRSSAFVFHVAAFGSPTLVALTRSDGSQLVHAQLPAPLELGRAYHFTMEHAGGRLRLLIDGHLLIDFADDEGIGAGAPQRFGFDNYPPNRLTIAHIQVFRRAPAQRVSPLEIGDTLFQLGLWTPAEQRYQDLIGAYPSSALATAAEYRLACCERQLGNVQEAATRLDAFVAGHPGDGLVPYALGQRLSLALAGHDAATIAQLRERLIAFPGHPVLLQALMDISNEAALPLKDEGRKTCADQLFPPDMRARVEVALAAVRGWADRYQTPLAVDAMTRCATVVFQTLGDSKGLLGLRESPGAQATGLYQMGRLSEVLRDFPFQLERRDVLFALGHLHEVAADPLLSAEDRARACFFAGDTAGIERFTPGSELSWLDRLQGGHYDAYLAAFPTDPLGPDFGLTIHARVLIAAKHYQEALTQYRNPSVKAMALLEMGHPEEAYAKAPWDATVVWEVAISELEAGQTAKAQLHFDELARGGYNHDSYSSAITQRLLPAVVASILGHHGEAIATLRAIGEREQHWYCQRLNFVCRYLTGECSDQAFLAQPFQLHVDTSLMLVKGLRCELEGDAAGAARHYLELLSLPYHRTALHEEPMAFITWRLRAQGIVPPPCLPLLVFRADL